MYFSINDFVNDWAQESRSTLKVFKNLTDQSLAQKVTGEGRNLGFIAWHIVLTLGEMGGKAGLCIDSPREDAPVPGSASLIVSKYEIAAQSFGAEVAKTWTDSMLAEKIEMYGEKWKRGQALAVLAKHEIHHRGQITVLMRQAGLKVPGVCGPSKEEWAQHGMPPMQ